MDPQGHSRINQTDEHSTRQPDAISSPTVYEEVAEQVLPAGFPRLSLDASTRIILRNIPALQNSVGNRTVARMVESLRASGPPSQHAVMRQTQPAATPAEDKELPSPSSALVPRQMNPEEQAPVQISLLERPAGTAAEPLQMQARPGNTPQKKELSASEPGPKNPRVLNLWPRHDPMYPDKADGANIHDAIDALLKSPPNVLTVAGHTPGFSAKALANMILGSGQYNKRMPVLLLVCFGNVGNLAQDLADLLQARVGYTDGMWHPEYYRTTKRVFDEKGFASEVVDKYTSFSYSLTDKMQWKRPNAKAESRPKPPPPRPQRPRRRQAPPARRGLRRRE